MLKEWGGRVAPSIEYEGVRIGNLTVTLFNVLLTLFALVVLKKFDYHP